MNTAKILIFIAIIILSFLSKIVDHNDLLKYWSFQVKSGQSYAFSRYWSVTGKPELPKDDE